MVSLPAWLSPSRVRAAFRYAAVVTGDSLVRRVQSRTPIKTGTLAASTTLTSDSSEIKVQQVAPYATYVDAKRNHIPDSITQSEIRTFTDAVRERLFR